MRLQYLAALFMAMFGIRVHTANAAVNIQESKCEIHAEPTADTLLSASDIAYDAQTKMMVIETSLRQLQSILRPAFQNRDIDMKQLNDKKNQIAKEAKELRTLRGPVLNRLDLARELQSIDHEMVCVDEVVQCATNSTCTTSEKKLDTCIAFPFHVFRKYASRLSEGTAKLLSEAKRGRDRALGDQINLPHFRTRLGQKKLSYEVLQSIDTTKWASYSTLGTVKELIVRSSRTIQETEIELDLCEKAQIEFIVGSASRSNRTEFESDLVKQDIIFQLQNVEASLLHLMNPEGMSREDIEKEKITQEAKFSTLRRRIDEKGLGLSKDQKSTIVKIIFLLSTI